MQEAAEVRGTQAMQEAAEVHGTQVMQEAAEAQIKAEPQIENGMKKGQDSMLQYRFPRISLRVKNWFTGSSA